MGLGGDRGHIEALAKKWLGVKICLTKNEGNDKI